MIFNRLIPFLFFSIPFVITPALAQNTTTWPEWVTNDYDCVIGCLSGFNSSMTTIPNTDLEQQAFSCVGSTCDSTYAMGNYYQALYYIQLFYATGSIYESSSSTSDSQAPSSTDASGSASDDSGASSTATAATLTSSATSGTHTSSSSTKTSTISASATSSKNSTSNSTASGNSSSSALRSTSFLFGDHETVDGALGGMISFALGLSSVALGGVLAGIQLF